MQWIKFRKLFQQKDAKAKEKREQGQSLVEFALSLPVVLLIILGTIDLGLGFKTYIALTNAAREGVRWVTIHPTGSVCSDGVLERIDSEAGELNLVIKDEFSTDGYEVILSSPYCNYAVEDHVTVNIKYDYPLLFGVIPGLTKIPFTASATMVVLYDE